MVHIAQGSQESLEVASGNPTSRHLSNGKKRVLLGLDKGVIRVGDRLGSLSSIIDTNARGSDGPEGKHACHQVRGPKFNPQNLHGRMREPTPTSCPLTSASTP